VILFFFLIQYTIVDIDVEAKQTDPQLIRDASGIKIGSEFRSSDIQSAVRNLARLKLFNFIAVDTSVVGDGIFVRIIVEEAPLLKSIPQFKGNQKIKNKEVKEKINLRIGQVITDNVIFESKDKILKLYQSKSFYSTTVRDSLAVDSLNKAELFFFIEEGIEPRIGLIMVEGNTAFSDDRIRKLMQNKPQAFLRSGKLDEEKLQEDVEKIKSFYKQNGYLDVQLADPVIDVENNKFIITITIQENRKYYIGTITFQGNSLFGSKELENLLTYESGDVYNINEVEESQQNVIAAYADEGYIFCSIVPHETARDSAIDIEYLIGESSPAIVNRVVITGNHTTRENVIRREIVTMPGERFRRSDLFRSMREIFNLGFFEDIQPSTGIPDDSGNIDLIYHVKEKEGVATVGAGISVSALDKLTGYFELSHPNLFGKGQRLYTKFEIGGRLTNLQLGFTEPWLFDTRTSVGFDIYYTSRFWDYYTKKDIGFAGRVTFPFYLDYTRFGYTLRTVRTQIVDISGSYTPPSSGYSLYDDTIPKWTVANTFSVIRDSRDYIFNPSSGSYLALRTEIAKKFLFADVDYNQFTFEARTYFPIFWKFVLMGRIKAGVVTSIDEVPFYERFYAGGVGDNGVRGYSDRSLSPVLDGRRVGGSALLINNIELKLKLSQSLAFLLFYDAGNAFPTYEDMNLHSLYRGVGAGVRIEMPMIGVLGFDMGYGLDRERRGFEPHFQINPFGIF